MNIMLITYTLVLMAIGKNIQDDKFLFIGVSLDNWQVIDFELSLRWEVESSSPFGITIYKTTGAIRNFKSSYYY